MPVSINSSIMSLRRQGVLLIRYSLSPDRYSRRVMVSSLYSVGRMPLLLTNVRDTSARPSAFFLAVPLKITLLIELERKRVGRCSPRTQRRASTILDLPHPLGPTIAVIPLSNFTCVLWAKLLKPCNSSSDIYIKWVNQKNRKCRRDTNRHLEELCKYFVTERF